MNFGQQFESVSSNSNPKQLSGSPHRFFSEEELLSLQQPAQYLGMEHNSVDKSFEAVKLHVALCFPDTYEVGMSHLGLQLLYSLFNSHHDVFAERVFMPQQDAEKLLREKNAPLCSLESQRPLKDFDIVGFSLQYELAATNVVAMLELGQIPIWSRDRTIWPGIIIGGGPFAYHPAAISPFFDLFFIGDAEEFVAELIATAIKSRQKGNLDRSLLITNLSSLDGVCPASSFSKQSALEGKISDHNKVYTRRLLSTLKNASTSENPIVPNTRIIHDRLAVEVMRGCVRGCRFCQAGFIYRPQREREAEEVFTLLQNSLGKTGFEEAALLSLSTADYCSLMPLLEAVMDQWAEDEHLALSFPSTRVDALTEPVLKQVQRVRKTGLTLAPEGGTQRIRNVINKGLTDQQIITTCQTAFRLGWKGVKLYFMIGLPTEEQADLDGIIRLAGQIKALPEAKNRDMTVSVSTFVPKPHTPFERCAQIGLEETEKRQHYLAQATRKMRINFRFSSSFASVLEGVISRGGSELAEVIYHAYTLGCRRCAWQEYLDKDLWLQAFGDKRINPEDYLKERTPGKVQPWHHISCGVLSEHFEEEYQRALNQEESINCRSGDCSLCGACGDNSPANDLSSLPKAEVWLKSLSEGGISGETTVKQNVPIQRIRIRYQKLGRIRFIGHLELTRLFHRAFRRAKLPLCYSQGFHPMPRLSFGPPLQLGLGSSAEYLDAFLHKRMEPQKIVKILSGELPIELAPVSAYEIALSATSIQSACVAQSYQITLNKEPAGLLRELLKRNDQPDCISFSDNLFNLIQQTELSYQSNKGSTRSFMLKDFVPEIGLENNEFTPGWPIIDFTLVTKAGTSTPKASVIANLLTGLKLGQYYLEKKHAQFMPV